MVIQDYKERNVIYRPEIGDLIIELGFPYNNEKDYRKVGLVRRATDEDFLIDWIGLTLRQVQGWFRYEEVQDWFKKKS